MENQQDDASSQFMNGDWSDKNIVLSAEFKLPSLSNPMNMPWQFDDNNIASFVLEKQFETLPNQALDTKGSLSMEELANSTYTPPLGCSNSLQMSNIRAPLFISNGSISMENHQIHVPSPGNTHWFDSNSSFPLRNQQSKVHVPTSFDSNGSSIPLTNQQSHVSIIAKLSPSYLNGSLPIRNQLAHVPSCTYTSRLVLNDLTRTTNQEIPIPNAITIPLLGSNGLFTMKNQQFNSFNFPKTPLFGSNSYLHGKNQLAQVPTPLPIPLSGSNVSLPHSRSQIGLVPRLNDADPFSHSNSFTKISQQSFVPNSSNASFLDGYGDRAWISRNDVHKCHTCHKVFPTTHALGGHMSSHAKARKREDFLAGLLNKLEGSPVAIPPMLGCGSGHPSHVSIQNYLLGIVEKKMKFFEEPKERSSSKPVGCDAAKGMKKIIRGVSSSPHDVFEQTNSGHKQEEDKTVEQDDRVEVNKGECGEKREHLP